MSRIIAILPKDEGFSQTRFGAISLCLRDFTLHSRYGAQTTVISGIGDEGFAGIDFSPAPAPRWYENRTRAYARHCVKVIRQHKAALVEIHNRPAMVAMIAPKVTAKIALHLHNDPQDMRDARMPVEREKLLAQCAGIYCVSEFIRGRFLEGLPQGAAQKLHVVHNGIAIPSTLPAKENHIVFAGRMTEGKGALQLAQALAIALPKLPEWRATLIGSDRHSPSEQPTPREREIMAALEPVTSQATMQGFLLHEETLAAFARASIAVVPSIWQEPFGRTAIEAMAYGCALISSGRGALQEVTLDAAYTLSTLDAATLAESITLLAQYAALRQKLQEAGRRRAEDFAIAKTTATLDKARDIILQRSAPHD